MNEDCNHLIGWVEDWYQNDIYSLYKDEKVGDDMDVVEFFTYCPYCGTKLIEDDKE